MAKEHAQNFMDQVARDPELQKQVRDLQTNIAALAKKHGYDFSAKEWHDSVREKWDSGDGQDDPNTCCICIPG